MTINWVGTVYWVLDMGTGLGENIRQTGKWGFQKLVQNEFQNQDSFEPVITFLVTN